MQTLAFRDSVASTSANTSLTADNIVDTYGGEDGTLNAAATSTAALAILACKVSVDSRKVLQKHTAHQELQSCYKLTPRYSHILQALHEAQ